MDFLHFIIGLHRELDVEIPEADYAKLTTKSDIVSYLQKKTAEERPPSNRPAS
jgi:acyl carrier protein